MESAANEAHAQQWPPVEWRAPIQEILRHALANGQCALALFDPCDNLAYANAAFCDAWDVGVVEGTTFASLIRSGHARGRGARIESDDIEAWIARATKRRRHGARDRTFEVDLCDGRWFLVTERRLPDEWVLVVGQDITTLKHSEKTLRSAHDTALKASLTDDLTQLPNRRNALQCMEGHFAAGRSFQLALIDVDDFKAINDRYGHSFGDRYLVAFAECLRLCERYGCTPARLAGDEFAIIGKADDRRIGFERALDAVLRQFDTPLDLGERSVSAAFSFGVAETERDGTTVEAMLHAADLAMYAQKSERGRLTRAGASR